MEEIKEKAREYLSKLLDELKGKEPTTIDQDFTSMCMAEFAESQTKQLREKAKRLYTENGYVLDMHVDRVFCLEKKITQLQEEKKELKNLLEIERQHWITGNSKYHLKHDKYEN